MSELNNVQYLTGPPKRKPWSLQPCTTDRTHQPRYVANSVSPSSSMHLHTTQSRGRAASFILVLWDILTILIDPTSMPTNFGASPSLQEILCHNHVFRAFIVAIPGHLRTGLTLLSCRPSDRRMSDECQQTLTTPFALNRHQLSHTGERRSNCKIPGCNQRFFNNSDCKRHEKSKKGHAHLIQS